MKNVAVVGFGFMGFTHALNILKSKRLKLCAIVETNPANIDKNLKSQEGNFSTGPIRADDVRKLPVYASVEECLAKEKLDALHICVHTMLHYDIAKLAMDKGLHVMLEKPITLDLKQGQELIDLAKAKQRIFMVAHVVRFMQPYDLLKQWIDTQKYGELEFLFMSRYSGLPAWGEWKTSKQVQKSCGGALFDLLIHDIDFVQYAVGQPSKIASTSLPGAWSDHDYVTATWDFESSKAKVVVQGGSAFHSTLPFEAKYIARFEKATIEFCTKKGDSVFVALDDKLETVDLDPSNDGYQNEVEYFAECLEKNQQPTKCTPESALRAIELCYRHAQ